MRTATSACLLLLLVAGCSSGRPASSAHVVVDEQDNGHTVRVARGDVVDLRLHSTYWQVIPTSGGELVVASRKVTGESPSSKHCVPGQGCGIVSVDFRAAR